MAKLRPFKIIIVGGGIAGLALANMLEKFDIEYVLLEGHDEIAPPVGASIGVMPNGLLILDQLGCYEAVKKAAQGTRIDDAHTRSSSGKSLGTVQDFLGHVEQRHGYPLLFFDRQWLLQVLYDQLQHKGRVLLRSKVDKIEQVNDCIKATTSNGQSYTGDILVGADGIHSMVRREMRRFADSTQPGTFPVGEEDQVPCYYQCSFGIAQHVDGWIDGEQAVTTGNGQSFLVVSGPESRVYWFLFNKLPEVKFGRNIPRYTKEDEEQFVKDYRHLHIKENLTFGQVYERRLTSTLTPLHEVVYKKWFFRRIVLMGDSVHKPNPIGGQGGNGAIESAAEFVNALLLVRDKRSSGLDGLSTEEIETVSQQMQDARYERAKSIVKGSHQQQSILAFENPVLSTLLLRIIAPLSHEEDSLKRFGGTFSGGARLNRLPVRARPRIIPFDHELPARPLRQALATSVGIAFSLSLVLAVVILTRSLRQSTGTPGVGGGSLDGPLGFLLNKCASLSVYQDPVSDIKAKFQLAYTLSQLASPLIICTVEGYRHGNRSTLLALPSLYAAAMQAQGIGRVAVVYAILSAWQSFQLPTGRRIPAEVARIIGPALGLSCVVSSMLVLWTGSNAGSWESLRAICQSSPLLFTLIVATFSLTRKRNVQGQDHGPKANGKSKEIIKSSSEVKPLKDCYRPDDVSTLQHVYCWAFILQSLAHLALVAYGPRHLGTPWTMPILAFRKSFAGLGASPGASKAVEFFEYDMALATLGLLSQTVYALWSLRHRGYVTTLAAIQASFAVMASNSLFGPSATLAGFWIWRERVISGLSTYK